MAVGCMTGKGIVVEFDFTALDGAELLFATTKSFLKTLDKIDLDGPKEARFLAGRGYQEGLAGLFAAVKTKKTAQKAARDLTKAFAVAVKEAVPSALTSAFRNFVKAFTEKGVKVVIMTRADPEVIKPAFDAAFGESVVLYQEKSDCYGSARWDSWRRACHAADLSHPSVLAITGSGFGVKSALHAGMGSVAVVNDHVAYQDFGGASEAVDELSGKTAKKILRVLGL